jgi:hypothetical protein
MVISRLHQEGRQRTESLLSLCLTCKLLNFEFQPLLYREIDIDLKFNWASNAVHFKPKSALIQRSLAANKYLGGCVRDLTISVNRKEYKILEHPSTPPNLTKVRILLESSSWAVLSEMISSMPNVRFLCAHLDLPLSVGEANWRLLVLTLQSFKQIIELDVTSYSRIPTRIVTKWLQAMKNIKRLDLQCHGPILSLKSFYEPLTLPPVCSPNIIELDALFLSMNRESLNYDRIVSRCKKLRWVQLHDFGLHNDCRHFFPKFHPTVQVLLSPIMFTLRELILSWEDMSLELSKYKPVLEDLQVSKFPLLQKLTIHRWIFERLEKPRDLYDAFFAGSLRELKWSFPSWSAASMIAWLRTLKDALLYSVKTGTSLRTVELCVWRHICYKNGGEDAEDEDEDEGEVEASTHELSIIEAELINSGLRARCSR